MRALSCVGSLLLISANIKPVPDFFSAKIAPSGEMIRECPSASKVTAPAKLQVKVGSVLSPPPFFRCACVVAGP